MWTYLVGFRFCHSYLRFLVWGLLISERELLELSSLKVDQGEVLVRASRPYPQAAFCTSYTEDLRRGSLPFSIQSFNFLAYT